jgi:predicted acyltransferase
LRRHNERPNLMADPQPVTVTVSPTPAPASSRLLSLDALRGLDMFWIIGADAILGSLQSFSSNPFTRFLANQFAHKEWEGFAFYDLIFPLFVFIVGVSLVFALSRTVEKAGRTAALKRIARRALLLYLLGVFYYGGLATDWSEIRWLGVLQRIALCYFFAGAIFCLFRPKALAVICAVLLAGYWAMLAWVPFPDVRPVPGGMLTISKESGLTNLAQLNMDSSVMLRGSYLQGVNLANYVDQKYLPGFKWNGTWDPEGLLSTIPAVGTCLLGVLAGLLLQSRSWNDQRKVGWLFGAGSVAVALGWAWHLEFPVIKTIWTSSYVLVAAGYSAWMLGAFYYLIEVRQWQRWAMPFVWIGMNPITVYLADRLIGFENVAARLAGGSVQRFLNTSVASGVGDLLVAGLALALAVGFCHFLYRRQIFIRL